MGICAGICVALIATGCGNAGMRSPTLTSGIIVFTSDDASGRPQIFTISPDGTGKRQLTNTTEGVNQWPTFWPNSSRILFSSQQTGDASGELYTMNLDGTAQARFPLALALAGEKALAQVSPDGTRIAFNLIAPSGYPEIWLVNADGSAPVQLTTTPVAASGLTWSLRPRWSPDGTRIFFASTRSGSTEIWSMASDGSDAKQITHGLGPQFPDANAPSLSHDGKRLALFAGVERQFGEIWTMAPDGTDARRLTHNLNDPGKSVDNPTWSLDGTKLLFDTNRSGTVDIWMMDADGGNQHPLITVSQGGLGIGTLGFEWGPIPP